MAKPMDWEHDGVRDRGTGVQDEGAGSGNEGDIDLDAPQDGGGNKGPAK